MKEFLQKFSKAGYLAFKLLAERFVHFAQQKRALSFASLWAFCDVRRAAVFKKGRACKSTRLSHPG